MHQNIYADMKNQLLRSKRRSIFRKAVSVMACTVMFCTTYALILPAITLEPDTFCGMEDHVHSEKCYAPVQKNVLICNGERLDIHVHSDGCYGSEGELVCGQCDYVAHAHDDSCRNEAGELVCPLEERSVHLHGDSCYVPGETLPVVIHAHSEACNAIERGELTCTQEEREGHTHGDACYEPSEVLLCTRLENHVHGDTCYQLPLTCSISTDPHAHGSDCYGRGSQTCGTEEGHVHGDGCYGNGSQICGTAEGHVHGDGCWETVSICQSDAEDHSCDDSCYESRMVCSIPENHSHGDGCYETITVCNIPENHSHDDSCYESIVVCGKEEGEQHVHGDGCYGTEAELICTEEENHVHEGGCYEPRLICTSDEFPGHAHSDECYEQLTVIACGLNEGDPEPTEPVDPVLVCTEAAAQVHVHGEGCFEIVTEDPAPICGEAEGHEHTFECYTLSCGLEEHEHSLACYSDPEADVESQATWEATMASVTLTGDKPTDVVAIAKSQLGYTESTRNYAVWEDDSIHGYTRYGAWYGVPYGDWCGMFASFCLRYAGVNDIPINYGVRPWIEELSALGLYYRAWETKPQVGSLIFYDWEGDGLSDHVGIVAEVHEADEYSSASITAIEGNSSNCVQYVTYEPTDSVILGYGLLPGQEPIPLIEETDPELQVNMDINLGPVVTITTKEIVPEEIENTSEKNAGEPEARVMMFAATPRASDMQAYLNSVGGEFFFTLTDENNNNLPVVDGFFQVEPDTPYKLTMTISSPDGFAPGTYTYQLPNGVRIKQSGSGNLIANDKVLGAWTITQDGLMTFEFFEAANTHTVVKLSAEMLVNFLEDFNEVEFDGEIKVQIVRPPEEDGVDIELIKWGGSPDGKTLEWQIRIDGYDGATIAGVNVKDTITSGNHSFTAQDKSKGLRITASGANGVWHRWDILEGDPNLNYWTETGWEYTMPEKVTCQQCHQVITLEDDWVYEIYYNSTPATVSDMNGAVYYNNHVEFGDHDYRGQAQINYGTPSSVEKSGYFEGDSEGGKFHWTIKASIPGMITGQKAVNNWFLSDEMDITDAFYQPIEGITKPHNPFDREHTVVTITRNGVTSTVNHIDDATADDEFVWGNEAIGVRDYRQYITFYCRCHCTEANCPMWRNGKCGETHTNGFCKCWTIEDNVEFTLKYEVDALTILEEFGDIGAKLKNAVEVWFGEWKWQAYGEAYIDFPSLLEKNITQDFGTHVKDKDIAKYTITVNEQKLDLSGGGNSITIIDKMTDSLVYIAGTMVITEEDVNGNTTVLTDGTDYSLTYDGSDRADNKHVITIEIFNPKAAMYTLAYDTMINITGNETSGIPYGNTAEITVLGKTLTADTGDKTFGNINFAAKSYRVDIIKTEDGSDVPLQGATFGLYHENGGLIMSAVSDENGELFFQTSITDGIILREHTPYYIQEISAPEGFVLDTNKYWFYFCDKGSGCTEGSGIDDLYPNSVRIPENEIHTFHLENTRVGYELPSTGGAGTIPYTMAGLLLMLSSAAYLMYSYKPRRREEL